MRAFFLISILFIVSCNTKQENNAGTAKFSTVILNSNEGKVGAMDIYCLQSFLTDPDPGGVWSVVTKPDSSSLSNQDFGNNDNPCIDFNNYGCGDYTLKYLVKNPCCIKDSVEIDLILPCCKIIVDIDCS